MTDDERKQDNSMKEVRSEDAPVPIGDLPESPRRGRWAAAVGPARQHPVGMAVGSAIVGLAVGILGGFAVGAHSTMSLTLGTVPAAVSVDRSAPLGPNGYLGEPPIGPGGPPPPVPGHHRADRPGPPPEAGPPAPPLPPPPPPDAGVGQEPGPPPPPPPSRGPAADGPAGAQAPGPRQAPQADDGQPDNPPGLPPLPAERGGTP